MIQMENTGLVLEGGGMRGVFTAGVLDYMMDNGIAFPYTIAVLPPAMRSLMWQDRRAGRKLVILSC